MTHALYLNTQSNWTEKTVNELGTCFDLNQGRKESRSEKDKTRKDTQNINSKIRNNHGRSLLVLAYTGDNAIHTNVFRLSIEKKGSKFVCAFFWILACLRTYRKICAHSIEWTAECVCVCVTATFTFYRTHAKHNTTQPNRTTNETTDRLNKMLYIDKQGLGSVFLIFLSFFLSCGTLYKRCAILLLIFNR